MPNPLHFLAPKRLLPQLKRQMAGLWGDFWNDGPETLLGFRAVRVKKPAQQKTAPKAAPSFADLIRKQQDDMAWRADAGEISEKMWGAGLVTPGDATLNNLLVAPLELAKNMRVLDLSAGLGARARAMESETGAAVTALEPDAALAARGHLLSNGLVSFYDPASLKLEGAYDAFLARELFYRVQDRPAMLAVMAQHAKPAAQIAFTDYVVDPECRDNPAIAEWRGFETAAKPPGLVETSEIFARAGFGLSLHEDLSGFYKAEVTAGIKNLLKFLAGGTRPDRPTAMAVLRRIELWKHRLAALEAGMKFYRFYGRKR